MSKRKRWGLAFAAWLMLVVGAVTHGVTAQRTADDRQDDRIDKIEAKIDNHINRPTDWMLVATLALFLVPQTGAALWWASAQSAGAKQREEKIDHLTERIDKLTEKVEEEMASFAGRVTAIEARCRLLMDE